MKTPSLRRETLGADHPDNTLVSASNLLVQLSNMGHQEAARHLYRELQDLGAIG